MRVAIVDLVLVIAGYLLVQFVSRALDLPTPGLLAVVAGVLIATWRLAASGESWRTVGIRKPPTWLGLALSVPALYLITIVAVTGLVLPLADALGWPPLELSTYRDVQGNPVALARILLVAWTTAAFGEEMLFRGFLQGRIRTVLGEGRTATAGAVILQALLFGAGHTYLGPRGVANAVVVGLIYGSWYLLRGRNLWPLILAHGLTDTISMLAVYFGVLPQE